ncbi:MAG: acyl carrier protein [Desulfovibrio sp.]|nr:acyl carrier protein [Desulfovibrio sp.]
MTKQEFLSLFREALQVDREISCETVLNTLDEWDSLAKIVVRGMAETQLGKAPSLDALTACVTVNDVATLLGIPG